MLRKILVIFLTFVIANCDAGILTTQQLFSSNVPNYSVVPHHIPTAVSHQTFTRIHHDNAAKIYSIPATQDLHRHAGAAFEPTSVRSASIKYSPNIYAVSNLNAKYFAAPKLHASSVVSDKTSVVETLTHTPAHLTYSASPVVFHMLPMPKPVAKIDFESLVPSTPFYRHYAN